MARFGSDGLVTGGPLDNADCTIKRTVEDGVVPDGAVLD